MNISVDPLQLEEILQILFPTDILTDPLFNFEKHSDHISKTFQNLNPILINAVKQSATFKIENILFRCPLGNQQFLKEFFQKNFQSQFKQPLISQYYDTSFFPCLKTIQPLSPKRKSQIETKNISTNNLGLILQKIYYQQGYISNLHRLLLTDPQLFLKNYQYQTILFQDQSCPLSIQQSSFLGIMAAAQYGCIYIVKKMMKIFNQIAGNRKFLNGQIPEKIVKMQKLCHFLVHCPWRINYQIIQDLLKDWKHAQLLHAAKVISYCQYLSSLALIFGLNIEENSNQLQKYFDLQPLRLYKTQIISKVESCTIQELKLSEYLMDAVNNQFLKDGRRSNKSDSSDTIQDTQQKLKKIDSYMMTVDCQIKSSSKYNQIRSVFKKILFLCKGVMKRENTDIDPHYQSDWNLQQNGYNLMQPICQQSTDALFSLINHSKSMNFRTSQTNNDKSIELQFQKSMACPTYRKSICYYSDSFLGFIHDGYDYPTKMKTMLKFQERFFIMMNTIFPYLASKELFKYINLTKNQDQSIFILINLIANNKMERSLTYFTKALRMDD